MQDVGRMAKGTWACVCMEQRNVRGETLEEQTVVEEVKITSKSPLKFVRKVQKLQFLLKVQKVKVIIWHTRPLRLLYNYSIYI